MMCPFYDNCVRIYKKKQDTLCNDPECSINTQQLLIASSPKNTLYHDLIGKKYRVIGESENCFIIDLEDSGFMLVHKTDAILVRR